MSSSSSVAYVLELVFSKDVQGLPQDVILVYICQAVHVIQNLLHLLLCFHK